MLDVSLSFIRRSFSANLGLLALVVTPFAAGCSGAEDGIEVEPVGTAESAHSYGCETPGHHGQPGPSCDCPAPPPGPNHSVLVIDRAFNGQSVFVRPGQVIDIVLEGNVTTGFAWTLVSFTGALGNPQVIRVPAAGPRVAPPGYGPGYPVGGSGPYLGSPSLPSGSIVTGPRPGTAPGYGGPGYGGPGYGGPGYGGPGPVGRPERTIFRFTTAGKPLPPGTQVPVVFTYARPWETNVPPADTFTVFLEFVR